MTGCERILARLERGPCTAAELYAETYTVVHSRISDLRKRGYVITCEHTGGSGASSILYTLSQTSAGEPSRLPTSPRGPVVGSDTAAAVTPSPAEKQLQLIAAA